MNTEKTESEAAAVNDLDELFLGFIQRKANSVEDRLKRQLRGKIKIRVRDRDKVYLFDGSGTSFTVALDDSTAADSEMELGFKELEAIVEKRLNVQIAMLSGRIKVSGNVGLAIYFFNLI
jgi:putative sterol carrier protein